MHTIEAALLIEVALVLTGIAIVISSIDEGPGQDSMAGGVLLIFLAMFALLITLFVYGVSS